MREKGAGGGVNTVLLITMVFITQGCEKGAETSLFMRTVFSSLQVLLTPWGSGGVGTRSVRLYIFKTIFESKGLIAPTTLYICSKMNYEILYLLSICTF